MGHGAGATEEAIEAPPTKTLTGLAQDETRCPICLEDYYEGAVLRHLLCRHSFHRDCLDRWLKHKATCPICQQGVTPDTD